jgi:hypothetical protein
LHPQQGVAAGEELPRGDINKEWEQKGVSKWLQQQGVAAAQGVEGRSRVVSSSKGWNEHKNQATKGSKESGSSSRWHDA